MRYKNEFYKNFTLQFRGFYDECGKYKVVAIVGATNIGIEGKTKQEAFEEAKIVVDGLTERGVKR